MNILPKKRWHVRTRENITRVRRDEAAAAEEEKKRIQKIELAEKEARTEILRAKAREKYGYVPKKEEPGTTKQEVPIFTESGHVNLFYELERNDPTSNKKNADHEKEAKAEREKEEMKIGYLTYLGQETNELTGNVSWYNRAPDRSATEEIHEVGMKEKLSADPLKNIRKYMETDGIKKLVKTVPSILPVIIKEGKKEKKKKKKKEKKKKSSKDESKKSKKKKKRRKSSPQPEPSQLTDSDIDKLRAERFRREKIERERTMALLAKLRGEEYPAKKKEASPEVVQKYNSQFNPMLARQNFLD